MNDPHNLKQPVTFFIRQAITGTLVLLLALFLLSDLVVNNSLFFRNPAHLTFKAKNGNFVCCDIRRNNLRIADRPQVGSWEQFSTANTKEGYEKFISSEGYPVSVDSFGNLKSMPGISSDKDFWKIENKGDSVLIHNKAGKYWTLGGLMVMTGPRSSADAFILTDLKKTIP